MRDQLPVREVQVTRQELVTTISTDGRVEPEENYEFYSPITTTVKAVYVQPGDHVQVGKPLIVLDDLDARAKLASAESGVKSAQAQLEAATHNGTQQEQGAAAADVTRSRIERDQAQKDLDALTKLKQTGAASSSEISAAQERLTTAEASLHAAEQSAHSRFSPAEVARSQASLTDANANLASTAHIVAQTSIRAPITGTIYDLEVGRTDFVEAGKLLLQIADLDHERVRAYFDEPEIGGLAIGQKVLIKWDAKPDREWHGHIIQIPVTIIANGTRRVGEVLVKIDDSDAGLLPDTNVTVKATTSSEPNALSVPREALHMENGKAYVFKVVNDELVRTPVVTGISNETETPILSGLSEGDWVATGSTSGQSLQEGVPIKVVR